MKRCIGCGKEFPKRGATWRGWWTVQLSQKGKGTRWYRNCGCMGKEEFNRILLALFRAGRDHLPRRLRLPQWGKAT
jgi:hypothetical protein